MSPRPASPLHDLEPEAARGALDRPDGGREVGRREVGHLEPRDLFHLLPGHLTHLLLARLARSLLDACRALEQHGGRRGLGDERERPVRVYGDDDWDDQPGLRLSLGVEGLAELHDVDAALAEGGSDRRAGAGLPRRHLELYLRPDPLPPSLSLLSNPL